MGKNAEKLRTAMAAAAEGQGFEPWEALTPLVFKTSAFIRSATPPGQAHSPRRKRQFSLDFSPCGRQRTCPSRFCSKKARLAGAVARFRGATAQEATKTRPAPAARRMPVGGAEAPAEPARSGECRPAPLAIPAKRPDLGLGWPPEEERQGLPQDALAARARTAGQACSSQRSKGGCGFRDARRRRCAARCCRRRCDAPRRPPLGCRARRPVGCGRRGPDLPQSRRTARQSRLGHGRPGRDTGLLQEPLVKAALGMEGPGAIQGCCGARRKRLPLRRQSGCGAPVQAAPVQAAGVIDVSGAVEQRRLFGR